MASPVKCRLCKKQIIYIPNQVYELGEHLLNDHPDAEMTFYSFNDDAGDGIRDLQGQTGDGRDFRCLRDKKKMYKTTVETWRQSPAEITCPKCQKTGQPLMRKQKNKVAKSSVGALCLLGCWPICFLPFMMGGANLVNFYCRQCGYFLGTYNKKTGQFREADNKDVIVNVPNICD